MKYAIRKIIDFNVLYHSNSAEYIQALKRDMKRELWDSVQEHFENGKDYRVRYDMREYFADPYNPDYETEEKKALYKVIDYSVRVMPL